MLREAKLLHKEQFGNDNFFVVLYPSSDDNSKIIECLKGKEVKYFDYSTLFDYNKPEYRLLDGHPGAFANRLVIEQLRKDLASIID